MELNLRYVPKKLLASCTIYELDITKSLIKKSASKGKAEWKAPLTDGAEDSRPNSVQFFLHQPEKSKISQNVKRRRYEGGFSIWESTWFLLSFLEQEISVQEGSLAIDLGCGNGICGISAIRKGYNVLFQDLNWEVLEDVVIPNTILNTLSVRKHHSSRSGYPYKRLSHETDLETVSARELPTVKRGGKEREYEENVKAGDAEEEKQEDTEDVEVLVYKHEGSTYTYASVLQNLDIQNAANSETDGASGPASPMKYELLSCFWSDMPALAADRLQKYCESCSLAIASECIYRKENYPAIADVLLQYLLPERGAAYIATKRLYFGMDGGSYEFMEYINRKHYYSVYELRAAIHRSHQPSDSSNVIDIIMLTKQKKST